MFLLWFWKGAAEKITLENVWVIDYNTVVVSSQNSSLNIDKSMMTSMMTSMLECFYKSRVLYRNWCLTASPPVSVLSSWFTSCPYDPPTQHMNPPLPTPTSPAPPLHLTLLLLLDPFTHPPTRDLHPFAFNPIPSSMYSANRNRVPVGKKSCWVE